MYCPLMRHRVSLVISINIKPNAQVEIKLKAVQNSIITDYWTHSSINVLHSTLESGISVPTGINVPMGKLTKTINVPNGINVPPGKFDKSTKCKKCSNERTEKILLYQSPTKTISIELQTQWHMNFK